MPFIAELLRLDINILIIGASNSGKTYLSKYIVKSLFGNKVDYFIVISPTIYNGDWDCIPPQYQFAPQDEKTIENAIQNVINYQIKHIKDDIHVEIIIDDSIGAIKFNSPFFTKLYAYRHPKITLITI